MDISGVLTAVLVGAALAGLGPVVAVLAHSYVEGIRKARAYSRLADDPLLCKGGVLHEIRSDGRDQPIVGPCWIVDLSVGRVVVERLDGTARIAFTGRELEALTPVVRVHAGLVVTIDQIPAKERRAPP